MTTINPFEKSNVWILSVFIFIYVCFKNPSFVNYSLLIFGLILLSYKLSSDNECILKVKKKRNFNILNFFVNIIPLHKYIFELCFVVYLLLGILKVFRYYHIITGFTLFWLGLGGFIYSIIRTLYFFKRNKGLYNTLVCIGYLLFHIIRGNLKFNKKDISKH